MKKVTAIDMVELPEGVRISYTYSEISEDGEVISENNVRSYLIVKSDLQAHYDAIKADILARLSAQ